jgi:hypothetical protein
MFAYGSLTTATVRIAIRLLLMSTMLMKWDGKHASESVLAEKL